MKIVYISSSTLPSRAANSIHVMKMCQAFAHNGHSVILLAPDKKHGLEPGVNNIFDFYGVVRNFELKKVFSLGFKGWSYFYGKRAAGVALRYEPDLVFCRNLAGCYYAALAGQEVVFEAHSPVVGSGKIQEWFFGKLIRRKELRRLVVITDALKTHFEKRYPELIGRIQVAPDGADPMPERIKPIVLPNSGKGFQVGYVGHLYNGRGVDLIAEVARHCQWAEFHFVGGTQADVDKWKHELKALSNCYFHGFVSPVEADRYRIAFDVLLAPYQNKVSVSGGDGDTSKWMSPLKIFEYMSAKKPIIATDMPAIREVLENGRNAILCNGEDFPSWCRALEQLSSDPELASRLANEAYDGFLSRFTWRARAKNILKN